MPLIGTAPVAAREFLTNRNAPSAIVGGGEPLSIVHVVRQYKPSIGGLEAVVEALAARQRDAGHDVRIVTLDRIFSHPGEKLRDTEVLDGITVQRIPYWGSRRYPIAPKVLRHIRDASIIHIHGIDFFFDFLALTAPLHRRFMIATTHGGFFHTPFASRLKKAWFKFITPLSARQYGAIIACSEADAAQFEVLRHPALVTIENGVELGNFPCECHRPRDEMIYFGRLAPNKGLHDLVDWFAAVSTVSPTWRLTIAGRPDGITAADIVDRAAARGLNGRVRVVSGPSPGQLQDLVSQASVYVSASHYEGFGIAPVEAAAAGLIPLLRDIPPFASIIARLESGLLTDFGTDRTMVEQTLAILGRQREMHARARTAEFGWDAAHQRYSAVYAQCMGRNERKIGRVAVRVTNAEAVLETFDSHVAAHEPLTIAFANAHTVNVADHDDDMAHALASAMVVNDGVGMDLASRALFGCAFPENLNGTDLTPALLTATRHNLRIFLLGAEPGIVERAARSLNERFPRHQIVGTHHGFFEASEEQAVVQEIRSAHPDLILVGMGHPRQEIWAARHSEQFHAVTMCVGAFIDRAAGKTRRPPDWVLRLRAEWVYRLLHEPRRLAARYLIGNIAFMARVLLQRRNGHLQLRRF
jgi:alpha-1,3-mannosyltransferase